MKFINREKELNNLNELWGQSLAHLIVIYGKRRVGKTEFIKQFLKDKPGVYFLADRRSNREQLLELGKLFGDYFKDPLLAKQGFSEWLDVFSFLKRKIDQPFVFFIDEYPYLVEADKSISSVFQKGWDEYLKGSKVFLILSGSSISMMESEALIYKSPLFGRRTGQYFIKPMTFSESRQFFPKIRFEDFLRIYSITGGMPAYILQFDGALSVEENVKKTILKTTNYLYNEVEFILKEELREPRNYLSILKAIAWGKAKFGEIVNDTGLEKNVLNKYLETLARLQLIEKEVPVTEDKPHKSRKGIYKITDNFCRFWFYYVFPYKSNLEIGDADGAIKAMGRSFVNLEANAYEKISMELLWQFKSKIFPFERIGRWWNNEQEIDLIGLNETSKEIIFGEVKWSNKQVGINIYEDLKNKAKQLSWNLEDRKEYYILFSKKGFSKELKLLAGKERAFLVEKDKLI
ncbi:MAG: ATP-binding protein [Candidatus Omnitrophica bacterium]|nr:ATP-binding protein [Candidatus Omnitrophota bacterium]